jgi:hypothetical protein
MNRHTEVLTGMVSAPLRRVGDEESPSEFESPALRQTIEVRAWLAALAFRSRMYRAFLHPTHARRRRYLCSIRTASAHRPAPRRTGLARQQFTFRAIDSGFNPLCTVDVVWMSVSTISNNQFRYD